MLGVRKEISSAFFIFVIGVTTPGWGAKAESPALTTSVQPGFAAPAVLSSPSDTSAPPALLEDKERLTLFGLLVDGGLPDGLGASLVFRPWLYTRLDAGITYNLVGLGVRGGITLVPFRWAIVPTLRLEAGHYFEGNASKLASNFGEIGKAEEIALSRIYYNYASAQIGLEFGSQNRFIFFIRGGIAYVSSSLKDFQSAVRTATGDSSVEIADPKIRGTMPSLNLGFLVFIY